MPAASLTSTKIGPPAGAAAVAVGVAGAAVGVGGVGAGGASPPQAQSSRSDAQAAGSRRVTRRGRNAGAALGLIG